MLKLLTCARGHFWEVAVEDETAVPAGACPECGSPADSLPLLDLAPAGGEPLAPALPPPPSLPAGLFDAEGLPVVPGYTVQEKLGRAPSGAQLFRAKQALTNRPVLLEVVVAKEDPGQTAYGALRGEASALGRLQHPHVVQIFEAGERERQVFYNVLERVPGGSLEQKVADKPLPFAQVARLVEVLARTLDHAHDVDIVHRNLRPGCVRLQPVGRPDRLPRDARELPAACQLHDEWYVPKLIGFGLARRPVEGDVNDLDLFGDDAGFLSPEQAWGRAREIGPATDVYGLGGLLYFLLTGVSPFQADTPQGSLDGVLTRRVEPPSRLRSRVPPSLDAICRRCLNAQPQRRYATARALADDLRRYQEGRPVEARPLGSAQRFGLWMRRRPAAAALLFLLLLGPIAPLAAYLVGRAGLSEKQAEVEEADQRAGSAQAWLNAEKQRSSTLLKQQELYAYLQRVGQANACLQRGERQRAEQLLNACPPAQRRWEWYHLARSASGVGAFDKEGSAAARLTDLAGPAASVAFHPRQGSLLAVGCTAGDKGKDRGSVSLRRLAPGEPPMLITDLGGPFQAMALTPDGRRLVTAAAWEGFNAGTHLRSWELEGPRRGEQAAASNVFGERVTELACTPDGASVLAALASGQLARYRARDLEPNLSPFARTALGFGRNQTHLALSRDGRLVASFCEDGQVVVLSDTKNGLAVGQLNNFPGPLRAVAFVDNANLAVVCGNSVQVWPTALHRQGGPAFRGQPTHDLGDFPDGRRLVVSPDGRRLAVGGGGTVRVWAWGGTNWAEALTLRAPTGGGLAFSPTGHALATAEGREVAVWGRLP